MRFAAYAGASTVLAAGVVLKAFHERPNFYSASVYLSQSNACRMILFNLALLITYGLMRGLQKLVYGPLRAIEREQLWDKAWYAVTETALAMTTFRDEVGTWFFIMFVGLLAGKVWQWISESRVEALEQQPPANPRLYHARLITSLVISEAFDLLMLKYCIDTLLEQPRPGMMVMFAFEFAVLAISSTSTASKYMLSVVESRVVKSQTKTRIEERKEELRLQREDAARLAAENGVEAPAANVEEDIDENEIDVPGWQEKGRWLLFLDLLTDLFKLIVYMCFFTILLMFHGIPIHIIRDVFLTTRSFVKRITDFFKYRNATRDMNARYPDATAEELARDGTCIICREEMQPWIPHEHQPGQRRPTRTIIDERQRPKKLPCGHVLHFGCLRSWLERQQVCPTCRSSVLGPPAAAPNRTQHNQLGAVGQNAHQPQVPGQAGAAQPGAANGAAPQRPRNAARARTFQLGTWRFTMAMGNEQQIQETMNQLRNRDHQEQNPPNSQVANQSRNPAVHGITEAIEGIRNAAPLQEQIARIERQISREITSLSAAQEQLALVRALQSELTRLRGQPDPASAGVVPPIPNVAAIGQSMSGFRPTPTASHMGFMNQPYVLPQQQGFASTSTQVLGPGHADLPAGMVLPEGWNMLPLQAINQHVHASASSSRARSNNGAVPANAVLLQTSMSNYNHAANNPAAPPPPQQQQQPHPHATTTQPPQERVSRHPLLRPTSPPPQRGMSPFTASRLAQQPHIAPSSPYPPHSQAQSIVSTPNTSPFSAHQRLQQYQQQTQQALQAQQDQQPPAHTWPTDDQASTSHYPYQQTPVALAPPAVAAQAEEEIISGLPNWGSSEQSTSTSNQNGGFNGGNDSADAPETSHDRKGKGKAATVEDGMEEDNMD